MSMTAEQLYLYVKRMFGVSDTILCDLHNPCKDIRKCGGLQHHPVINFDLIKTAYHSGKNGDTPASVDGITFISNRFCFVEVKGWMEFLAHLRAKNKDVAIKKKAASYNLSKKLLDSINICQSVSGLSDLLSSLPVTFVLVTDIETESNGLFMFQSDLLRLADPADNWWELCNRELKSCLDTVPGNIPTVYISCKDFDEKIAKLA